MGKHEILRSTTFGKTTAEEDGADLGAYFVETDQWQRIFAGDIDVVYGAKGSGKSAIYSLLLGRTSELFDRGIIVVAAENPRGAVAFRDLVTDPPTDENEFRNLWKLYFLVLIAHALRDYGIVSERIKQVIEPLEEARLLPRNASLSGYLRSARDYVRRLVRGDAIAFESTLEVDPLISVPTGITARIRFKEPNPIEAASGWISVDHLLELANAALEESGFSIWLALDRLDVAFAESSDLERNALRTLFRAYLDLRQFTQISLKIFLRTDLWKSIIKGGFREASHITRQITIAWDEASLLNLVIRRALHNDALRAFYQVDLHSTLSDTSKQSDVFYRIFPIKINAKHPLRTFEWILQHTRDGSRNTAPRELVHLFSSARDVQLRRLEIGHPLPQGEQLFDRAALVGAVPEVSKVRFEQTLCAEFPDLRDKMQKLEGEKPVQSAESLALVWAVDQPSATRLAERLVEVGFFQLLGTRRAPRFSVPFLYRSALKMTAE
jgi:hypothetical protein